MRNSNTLPDRIRRIRSIYRSSGSIAYTMVTVLQKILRKRIVVKNAKIIAEAPPWQFLDKDIAEKFILGFRITGGLGDHLIAARYIRDLLSVIGSTKFDIYSSQPEIAQWVFSRFPEFNNCFDEAYSWCRGFQFYPLAIWLSQFVYIHCNEANWWAVQKYSAPLLKICKKINKYQIKLEPFIEHHPFMDGFLARVAVFDNMRRNTFLQGTSGIDYGGDRLPVKAEAEALKKFGLAGKRYITVHNGFDTEFQIAGKNVGKYSTKYYPHFEEAIAQLKAEYPDLYVIQLGTTTSQPILNVDVNLICKTNLPEMAAILQASLLHIDNESGLVHLAACLGVKSCVLFGPTSADYYGYADNINISPNFCGGCWWVTEDWMRNCPRGFATARCLSDQPASAVSAAISPYLAEHFISRQSPKILRL